MAILQSLFALVVLGIMGFIAFWFGIGLKAGPKATEDQVNNDPRI